MQSYSGAATNFSHCIPCRGSKMAEITGGRNKSPPHLWLHRQLGWEFCAILMAGAECTETCLPIERTALILLLGHWGLGLVTKCLRIAQGMGRGNSPLVPNVTVQEYVFKLELVRKWDCFLWKILTFWWKTENWNILSKDWNNSFWKYHHYSSWSCSLDSSCSHFPL